MIYPLIEMKLRRFIYLGHNTSIYVNPIQKTSFWKHERNHYELNGVKMIGDIVEKNITEDINSIVPIILKIEKEKKLENYEYLMYLLAVCAKFKHQKLSTDTYAVLKTICTDGFKLLMFYKFCNNAAEVLHRQGYIPKISIGYGNGSRKAFEKWYLEKNPLETIESIIKLKKFRGVSHKTIMNTIHLDSKDPSHKIYIVYIRHGINKMEEIFGPNMREVKDVDNKSISSKEQKCIYNYIKLVHRIENSKESKLLSDTKWSTLGKHFELIVPKMLLSTKVLISFVQHLPLKTLLKNTYAFHKHGLFKNLLGKQGCTEFMSRFRYHSAIHESGIHPIDSYLEFLRYDRTGTAIARIKKRKFIDQMVFVANEVEQKCLISENLEQGVNDRKHKIKKNLKHFRNSHLFFMKPTPTLVLELKQFLSFELVERTLRNLKPSGLRLLIAYDNRICMKSIDCRYMHLKFVKVFDAIVMIIQSMVYQEKSKKPTVCALFDNEHRFRFMKINHRQTMLPQLLKKKLFKTPPKYSKRDQSDYSVKPLSTIKWAKKHDKIFDVFLFLGTSKMDLTNMRKIKINYEAHTNKKIKIITCSLNGGHSERVNISRDGMLFIPGFDQNTPRMIDLFMKNTI